MEEPQMTQITRIKPKTKIGLKTLISAALICVPLRLLWLGVFLL